MIDALNAYILASLLFVAHEGVMAGLLFAFVIFHLNHKKVKEITLRGKIFKMLIFPPILVLLAFIAAPIVSNLGFNKTILASTTDIYFFGFYSILSIGFAIYLLRQGVQIFDSAKKKLTVSSAQERNKKTDVRNLDLPEMAVFDPTKYYDLDKGLFSGIDENGKPVYISKAAYQNSNILLTGRTRSFKGVVAQSLLTQSIAMGEFVVFLDPKRDAWMPHILRDACVKYGFKYNFLDLNQNAPMQTNLFYGCDSETIENMLIGGFSLGESGGDSDHYRLADRRCARQAARWLSEHNGKTIRDVLEVYGEEWADAKTGAVGFHSKMAELAELNSINAPDGSGIDLASGEAEGGCLYVVGDMLNTTVVRCQRIITLRFLYLAKNRKTLGKSPRLIRMVADEFKAHISRPIVTALGITLGFKLAIIAATQSFEDFKDCPADLDKDVICGSVMENCAIKLSYAIADPDTCEKLCKMTGTILVDDESRNVEKNLALSETVDGKRTIRQTERYYIDQNMMSNLRVGNMNPAEKLTASCAVVIIAGQLARYCFTSPIKTTQTEAAITPISVGISQEKSISIAQSQIEIKPETEPDFEPVDDIFGSV